MSVAVATKPLVRCCLHRIARGAMLLWLLPLAACASAGLMPGGEANDPLAATTSSQGRPKDSAALAAWKVQVSRQLERRKRYPAEAKARREQGTVYVTFTIDRQGRLTRSRIVRGSGFASLDNETLELVRRAQPFPPPPTESPATELNLVIPVRYVLRWCGALGWLWGSCTAQ